MSCGGTSDVYPATEEIQSIINQVKASVQAEMGKDLEPYKAISYKGQVVAGMNYFVKIEVGEKEHIHVRVHQPLPHTNKGPKLSAIRKGLTLEAEISYFD